MKANRADLRCLSEAEQKTIEDAWHLSDECRKLEARQEELKKRIAERASCISLGIQEGPRGDNSKMLFDKKPSYAMWP